MNIVNSGNRFQIYGEDVRTFKELPVASYDVAFSKMSGFYLMIQICECCFIHITFPAFLMP